jgi:hypothetical protein
MKKLLLIFVLNFLLLTPGLAQIHFEYGKIINQTNGKVTKVKDNVINGNDNNSILINAPTLLSPANHSEVYSSFVMLQWKPVDSAAEYELQVSKDPTFNSIDYDYFTTMSSNNYTYVQFGNTYYWRVQARDPHMNKSNWSDVWEFNGVQRFITLINPSNNSIVENQQVVFTWNALTGTHHYLLQISSVSDFSSIIYQTPFLYSSTFSYFNITCGIKYYWQVMAYNNIGVFIAKSETRNFIYRTSILTTPELISPVDNTILDTCNLTLQWQPVTGDSIYNLEVSTDSTFTSVIKDSTGINSTSYHITNLTFNANYFWRVRAENGCQISNWSKVWNFTASSSDSILYLASPPDNSFLDVGAGKPIILKWNPVCEASKYRLEVSPKSDFNIKFYDTTNIYLNIILPLYGWQACMPYYWRVSAFNSIGELINQSEVWKFTLRMSDPDAPELISPKNISVIDSSNVTLQWHPYIGDLPYTLELSNDSTFATFVEIDTALTDTSHILKNLKLFTKYFWRVRAENSCYISDWSEIWNFSITYHISVLTLISPINNSVNEMIYPSSTAFVWNSVPLAEHYRIEISTNPTFATLIDNNDMIIDTTYFSSILLCGIRYFWRVSAFDITNKLIARSNEWNFSYRTSELAAPKLKSPINDTIVDKDNISFIWFSIPGDSTFTINVSIDSNFSSDYLYIWNLSGSQFGVDAFAPNTRYYWRLRAENKCAISNWSEVTYFKTSPNPDFVSELPNDSNNSLKFIIYPNPATNSINIYFQNSYSSNTVLKIINECGIELIKKGINNQNNIEIDLSNLSSGVYYCILRSEANSLAQKFTIIK